MREHDDVGHPSCLPQKREEKKAQYRAESQAKPNRGVGTKANVSICRVSTGRESRQKYGSNIGQSQDIPQNMVVVVVVDSIAQPAGVSNVDARLCPFVPWQLQPAAFGLSVYFLPPPII
ncbi:hypothetical protein FPOAC2_13322 [Fusarium poae]|jgi:hypothetical protein